jgi:hypothetical protein
MFEWLPGISGAGERGLALTAAFILLCIAQIVFLARHWMRVTARDHEATWHLRMASALEWTAPATPARGKAKRRGGLRR